MLFETFSMGFWVLLLCAAYAVKTSLSFLVTQSPGTIHVSVGDPFTIKCKRESKVTYCFSSTFWHKLNPRTGKLTDISDIVSTDVKPEDDGESCSLTISSATIKNSGTYYCAVLFSAVVMVGNGTRVIVTDRGPIMPSIIMYSPSDFVGPTGPLQCLVKGAVPSQVRVVWIIDQSNRTGLTESAWTENSDSADEYTRATITITAEEWAKATHIECVVMYDGVEISKTLNRDSACIWLLYAGIAAVFLTVAVTVTLAVYLHKDLQSATTIKGYRGTYAQGKQNNGNRDTLRPTAMRPSAIMEVEYSSVNPDSFNQLGVVPPSEFD